MNTKPATLGQAIDDHALSVINGLWSGRRNAADVTADILRAAGWEAPRGYGLNAAQALVITALRPYGVRIVGKCPDGRPALQLVARPTK